MALVIALYKLSLGDILTFPSYLFTRVIYGLTPIKLDKLTKLCGARNCHETAIEVINSKTFAKAKRISYLDYLTV